MLSSNRSLGPSAEPELVSEMQRAEMACRLAVSLRAAKACTGLTIDQMAVFAGTARSTMQRYLSGKRVPGAITLKRLADSFSIPLDSFFEPGPRAAAQRAAGRADLPSLSANLRAAKTATGLTVDELALFAGTSRTSMSRYLIGEREPDAITLKRLADSLGVDADNFFGDLKIGGD